MGIRGFLKESCGGTPVQKKVLYCKFHTACLANGYAFFILYYVPFSRRKGKRTFKYTNLRGLIFY
mgnify:CR=1 FL=1